MASLWGGETIKDLALPALGGAEHEALRPCSSAPLEPPKISSFLEHSAFLSTCPNLARTPFCRKPSRTDLPPNVFF